MTTRAPARWSRRAISAPIPCEEPVTSAVWPERSIVDAHFEIGTLPR